MLQTFLGTRDAGAAVRGRSPWWRTVATASAAVGLMAGGLLPVLAGTADAPSNLSSMVSAGVRVNSGTGTHGPRG